MNVALEVTLELTDNWTGDPKLDPLIAPGEKATPAGPPPQMLKIPGAM
jgi:hypothetical protein